jgi:hypothetical protein
LTNGMSSLNGDLLKSEVVLMSRDSNLLQYFRSWPRNFSLRVRHLSPKLEVSPDKQNLFVINEIFLFYCLMMF